MSYAALVRRINSAKLLPDLVEVATELESLSTQDQLDQLSAENIGQLKLLIGGQANQLAQLEQARIAQLLRQIESATCTAVAKVNQRRVSAGLGIVTAQASLPRL